MRRNMRNVYIVIDKARWDDENDDMEVAFLSKEKAEEYIVQQKSKRPCTKFDIESVILAE